MFERIISAPLNKPPRGARHLSSKDNLLIALKWQGFVITEDDAKYHFAMHSPAEGWQGYRWNEEYGEPVGILPVSRDTVWVHTEKDYVMRLQISQGDNAAITASTKIYKFCAIVIQDACESCCLVKKGAEIIRLRFDIGKGQLSEDNLYAGGHPACACFLSDGAIAIFDRRVNHLFALSPKGNRLHKEKRPCYIEHYYQYRPFIVVRDRNNDLYYTDDLRKGWAKSDVLKVHLRQHNNHLVEPFFITILGDEYYIALREQHWASRCYHAYLYRCPLKSPEHIKYVWGIATDETISSFAFYNGLICATSGTRVRGIGDTCIPDNDGFLVWDPITNTFYTDIPRPTNIQKISSGRIPPISIPDIWGRNAPQR